MKTVLVRVVVTVAISSTLWLAWLNRASEKITSVFAVVFIAAVSTLWLASMKTRWEKIITASLTASVTVWLTVLVFGAEPPITEEFPVCFFYRAQNKMPVSLPTLMWGSGRFTLSLFDPTQLHKIHPEYFSAVDDPNRTRLYHHLLQKAIVDWMGVVYGASWQAEITRFDLPVNQGTLFGAAHDTVEPSRILSAKDIQSLLSGNWFASVHDGIPVQIALPSGTRAKVTPPQHSEMYGEMGEIVLENDFCKISIHTQFFSSCSGIGAYKVLTGLTEAEDNQLFTSTYIVKARAEFSRLRSGHPRMQKYKAWARQLIVELKGQFDEELIWKKTREAYVFRKQLEEFGPVPQE